MIHHAFTWFVGWSIKCWLRRVMTLLRTWENDPCWRANSSWWGLMSRITTRSWRRLSPQSPIIQIYLNCWCLSVNLKSIKQFVSQKCNILNQPKFYEIDIFILHKVFLTVFFAAAWSLLSSLNILCFPDIGNLIINSWGFVQMNT